MKTPVLIKLITADKTLLKWRSLPKKLKAIYAELDDITDAVFTIDIEYRNVVPEVRNGYISSSWLDGLWSTLPEKKPDFLVVHMSKAQRALWKVLPQERGRAVDDTDGTGEAYFWADEKTKARDRKNVQFIETFLHEIRHLIFNGLNRADDTHEIHATTKTMEGAFKGILWRDYNPLRKNQLTQISLIERVLIILKIMKAAPLPLHPVIQFKPLIISQAYGVKNALYPKTGRHIGTDYPLPRRTSLYAPWDGSVTTAGSHRDLGYYLHFQYTYKGVQYEERWCHLDEMPKVGNYRRGSKVAYSGNTGLSTGPHLHREVWKHDVRVDLITKTNWSQLTLDPESHI